MKMKYDPFRISMQFFAEDAAPAEPDAEQTTAEPSTEPAAVLFPYSVKNLLSNVNITTSRVKSYIEEELKVWIVIYSFVHRTCSWDLWKQRLWMWTT